MKITLSLLITITLSLVTVMILLAISNSMVGIIDRSKKYKTKSYESVIHLNIALAGINLIGFNYSLYIGSPRLIFIVIGALGICGIIYLFKGKNFTPEKFTLICISIGISSWLIIPNIIFGRTSGALLNMVTHGNNDIANYAASSQHYLNYGFYNEKFIYSYNFSEFNLNSAYQSPNNLLAFIAGISNLKTWQITTPAMLVAITFGLLAISRLIAIIWNEKNYLITLGIAFIIFSTGLIVYVEGNYFLGQIMSISISISIIANLISFYKEPNVNKLLLIELGSLFLLSIFTYPNFLIPFFAISFCLMLCLVFLNRTDKGLQKICWQSLSITLAGMLSINYIPTAVKLALTQANVVAGWPIPQLNPISMIFFPNLIGIKIDLISHFLIWGASLIGLVLLINTSKNLHNKRYYLFLAIAIPILILALIVFRGRGFDDYGSWKLQSFFLPIYFALLLPVILNRFSKLRNVLIIFLVGVLVPSPISNWSYDGVVRGFYINNDLITVGKLNEIKNLKKLNIDLQPYFETMSAGNVISGPVLYINSLSYWPQSVSETACFLVNLPPNKVYNYVKPLNSSYAIASNSLRDCPEVDVS